MSRLSIDHPICPNTQREAEPGVTPENERTVRERLKTYECDKAAARPWHEVKARLLRHPKP